MHKGLSATLAANAFQVFDIRILYYNDLLYIA